MDLEKRKEYVQKMRILRDILNDFEVPGAFDGKTSLMNYDIKACLQNLKLALSSSILYFDRLEGSNAG